jgi:hypothetical protein
MNCQPNMLRLFISTKRKKVVNMANLYSIETLLEGKLYRSQKRRGLEGLIQFAEKRSDVYYDNAEAYLVKVRPTYTGSGIFRNDFYATIAVKVGE